MTFQSAVTNTSPRTESQLRQSLGHLDRRIREQADSIDALLAIVEILQEALEQESEADERIEAGEVVYVSSDGHVALAQADSATTAFAAGIARETANTGFKLKWTAAGVIEDDSLSLTPNALYFLSAVTAGLLVSAPDSSTTGHYVTIVGRSITPTKLLVHSQPPIKL